jgi:alpha-L-fucosidase
VKYEPNLESVKKHKVPEWFHDAKFGIFIHWGLYSVPAFAIKRKNTPESFESTNRFAFNPYAEWYLNTLRNEGSPTQEYQAKTYGKDFSYYDFIPIFNEEIQKWNPKQWVELFKKVGARYVVITTKHHDGFLLWPSKYPNPKYNNFTASRDIVGELTTAVKEHGMRMGLYYSGTYDWSFNPNPIIDRASWLTNGVLDPKYAEYANNHWYELIDRYEPIILWNDIGYPPSVNLNELFSYFYNKFPDGVINNRWMQLSEKQREEIVKKLKDTPREDRERPRRPKEKEESGTSKYFQYDFITPEYSTIDIIFKTKWETCRGIGNSFGYNKLETEEDHIKPEELIRLFVDIVSKNGNLLLNVGPKADGTIPKIQEKILLEFGEWLKVNGEAIYGTRPWERAEGKTSKGIDIRFTEKKGVIYIHLFDKPQGRNLTILSLTLTESKKIQLLGSDGNLIWKQVNENIEVFLPEELYDSAVYVLKIF